MQPNQSSQQQPKKILKQKALWEKATDWIGSTSSLVVHTILFLISFLLGIFGVNWDRVLLVLTTLVSLEAIYLAIFIQIGVNRTNKSLKDVEEDIEEIQEDVGEIQEDVGELQEDLGEIQEDVSEIQEDVGEMQDDFDDVQTDSTAAQVPKVSVAKAPVPIENIEKQLRDIIKEMEKLKK
jgi:uncharacterized membrane protein